MGDASPHILVGLLGSGRTGKRSWQKTPLDANLDERAMRINERYVQGLDDATCNAMAQAGIVGDQADAFSRALAAELRGETTGRLMTCSFACSPGRSWRWFQTRGIGTGGDRRHRRVPGRRREPPARPLDAGLAGGSSPQYEGVVPYMPRRDTWEDRFLPCTDEDFDRMQELLGDDLPGNAD